MLRGSVTSGMRRRMALPRSCCALLALAVLLGALQRISLGQSPVLDGPASEASESAPPPLPPPAPRPASVDQKAPGSPATVEPTTAQPAKARDSKPSKPTEDLDIALERQGELNLHGVSLDKALFMIGEQWNINIVAGDVKGTVNGTFKQAPLREILDAILLSNGYNYRAVGKSLVISSIEQLGQINPFFQSAIIPVQTADIDEVVQGAQLLKTPKGEVRPIKSAKSIVVLDFPDRVKMIRDFVATIDNAGGGRFASVESRNGMPLEVGYFRTQHISAKSAEQALQAVLSKAGKATVMEKEDRLLVTDYSDNLEMVEKVMKSIDRPRPQVRITALIYDISLQDVEQLGLDWNKFGYRSGENGVGLGIHPIGDVPLVEPNTTLGTTIQGATVAFGAVSRHLDINAVVLALQNAKDARLLADPNVAVLENEDAEFKSVTQIPIQQLTQTQQGGNIGTTAFKEAGINLHVRPKISSDGLICMTLKPEFSRFTGYAPDGNPIIDERSAETVLSVANRQTVVIGGLRQRTESGNFNGVPYLKDLKVVGRFFRSRDLDVRESELVVFISPEIISYSDEPTCRQKIAAETIHCRIDQVPEAEGCPPCCRRLPVGSTDGMFPGPEPSQSGEPADADPMPADSEQELPLNTQPAPEDSASANQPYALEPLSAVRITSDQYKFGASSRNEQTGIIVNDGRLRRLPVVVPIETRLAVAPTAGNGIFAAPPAVVPSATPIDNHQLRAAERGADDSIWR